MKNIDDVGNGRENSLRMWDRTDRIKILKIIWQFMNVGN